MPLVASVTLTVKLKVPAVLAMPLIVPVVERVRFDGREPLAMEKV